MHETRDKEPNQDAAYFPINVYVIQGNKSTSASCFLLKIVENFFLYS